MGDKLLDLKRPGRLKGTFLDGFCAAWVPTTLCLRRQSTGPVSEPSVQEDQTLTGTKRHRPQSHCECQQVRGAEIGCGSVHTSAYGVHSPDDMARGLFLETEQ